MSADHKPGLADLQAFLAASERHEQQLRALIESEETSASVRMQALLELAQLSSDLTALLLEVIRNESE